MTARIHAWTRPAVVSIFWPVAANDVKSTVERRTPSGKSPARGQVQEAEPSWARADSPGARRTGLDKARVRAHAGAPRALRLRRAPPAGRAAWAWAAPSLSLCRPSQARQGID
eukprot:scaffold70261_cov32-Tisochrysis_lutea.AAC.2